MKFNWGLVSHIQWIGIVFVLLILVQDSDQGAFD